MPSKDDTIHETLVTYNYSWLTIKSTILFIGCMLLTLVYLSYIQPLLDVQHTYLMSHIDFQTNVSVANPNVNISDLLVYNILLWTTFFGEHGLEYGEGTIPFSYFECLYNNCYVTRKRSMLNHTHAIVFHNGNIDRNDLPEIRLDKTRYIYIYYVLESPSYSQFNVTMTYRRDSDIVTPYGEAIPGSRMNKVSYKDFKVKKITV